MGVIGLVFVLKLEIQQRSVFCVLAIKRSQSRILVNRGPNAVSLYSWILPHQAEPLVEFGSSHRIVWVSRLPSEGSIFSIGTGIIGSSDEEKSRTRMDWKDGGIYLVPSNGGKAVGFVYHASDSSEQGSGHAELKIAKIPQEMLIDSQGKESVVHFSKDDAAPYHRLWVNSLEEKCRDLLESERTQTPTGNLLLPSGYYFVGAHNVDALKTAFRDGESASNKRSSNS